VQLEEKRTHEHFVSSLHAIASASRVPEQYEDYVWSLGDAMKAKQTKPSVHYGLQEGIDTDDDSPKFSG
jgi:hypothetical protein